MLQILVNICDKDGIYGSAAELVIETMNENEGYCQSAPQQISNGAYRMAEMLKILVQVVAPEKADRAQRIMDAMYEMEDLCQSAPQQTANGTDAAACLVELLVEQVDQDGKYADKLGGIVDEKESNNASCQGADQQSANYIYRMMEMAQIVAMVMDDKKQEVIARYWLEHYEEKTALLNEKKELEDRIDSIEQEAKALNADAELAPVRAEIKQLKKEYNECGVQELKDAQKKIDQAQAAHDALGFFKFKERKEAKAQIESATAALSNKQTEVKKAKDDIQKKINSKEREIERINEKLEAKRKEIRSGKKPAQRRIEKIDYELTCPR